MGGGQLPHFFIIASEEAILGPEGLKVSSIVNLSS